MGARHSRMPHPRTRPLFSTPYMGKTADADKRPTGETHRLVRFCDAWNSLGGACSEGDCVVDEEIRPGQLCLSTHLVQQLFSLKVRHRQALTSSCTPRHFLLFINAKCILKLIQPEHLRLVRSRIKLP